jgi:signal peptidase I
VKRRHAFVLMTTVLLALAGCGGDSWSSGDRVIVAKFVYDSHLEDPERYQVVVFKYPGPDGGPVKEGVPTNYIKRLLGLPGELLAIFFGRIYRCDDEPSQKLRDELDQVGRSETPLDLWRVRYLERDDHRAITLFNEGKFRILRKPPATMLAMRRLVYDNDHQAKDLHDKLPPRWVAQSGDWIVEDDGTGFHHAAKPGQEIAWLRYQHILRPSDWPEIGGADRKPQLIRDFSGYNSYETAAQRRTQQANNWVGDLMLEFDANVERAEGELRLELARGGDRFQARWNLQTGECSLFRLADHSEQKLASAMTRVKAPGSYQLRFANFDDRLTVWVDRDLPFGDGAAYNAAGQPGPTENDLRPALIGIKDAGVKIRHLRLWRDSYYTSSHGHVNDPDAVLPGRAGADFWSNPKQWAPLRDIKPTTLYVQRGHYLCLGDNSPESSDSRVWGTVPERLLLGRALAVYYPLNRVGAIK